MATVSLQIHRDSLGLSKMGRFEAFEVRAARKPKARSHLDKAGIISESPDALGSLIRYPTRTVGGFVASVWLGICYCYWH